MPLNEHELTSLFNDFQNAQKERIKIKQQANSVFESQSSGAQSAKQLEELEDEHQKMYLSKINLAEKYQFARQLYHLAHNHDRRMSQSGLPADPHVEKVEKVEKTDKRISSMDIGIKEDAWQKIMQKLDWDLLDTPTSIRGMADIITRSENDNLITMWYWELKNGLIDAFQCRPPCKLSSASENPKTGSGIEPDSNYDIKFDHPLVLSAIKFREMVQIITTSGKNEKRDVHFISPEMELSLLNPAVFSSGSTWISCLKAGSV
ncbi:17229_t:CDS:2 [Gigaspora rosea]|nr:17229_t:CDS:2 [Gigaspora rosea]